MPDNTTAPAPRATGDANAGRLPAARETFKSDSEFQTYNTQYNWEKSQQKR